MTLGRDLIAARKAAGLTIDDLSTRTNIRVTLLKEFEANNFVHAGGDTYVRGHLKTIARIYGISAEAFLEQYDSEHATEARAIHDQLVESNVTRALPEKSKYTYKQVLTTSVIGIVLLLFASFILNNLRESATSPKATVKANAEATPAESKSPNSSASSSASSTSSSSTMKTKYSSGSGVSVKLEAVDGASWLFVKDKEGTTLFSGRATQGQVFEFSSTEEVNLRIGNAGAVKLTVNGKEVSQLGAIGEVVDVSYGVNS